MIMLTVVTLYIKLWCDLYSKRCDRHDIQTHMIVLFFASFQASFPTRPVSPVSSQPKSMSTQHHERKRHCMRSQSCSHLTPIGENLRFQSLNLSVQSACQGYISVVSPLGRLSPRLRRSHVNTLRASNGIRCTLHEKFDDSEFEYDGFSASCRSCKGIEQSDTDK